MQSSRLTDLAKAILANAEEVEEHLKANGHPQPSFDEHSPPELPLPPGPQQKRQKAVDAAMELQDLLNGPAMQLRPVVSHHICSLRCFALLTHRSPAEWHQF